MKFLTIIFLILSLPLLCRAHSGGIKTPEDPADSRPRSVKDKAKSKAPQSVPAPVPTPAPSPTPSPARSDDDDIIKIDSILIPIPVSVTDDVGRAITTLQLKDFELLVDT